MQVSLRHLVVLSSAALLAACTSSPMSRIDQNRAAYDSWPIEIRQAVLDGRVEKGMNAEMVRVIHGKPSEVTMTEAGEEIWTYREGGGIGSGLGGGSTGISIGAGSGGVSVGTGGGIGMGGGQVMGDYREVVFRDGQVVRGDGIR